MGAGSVQDPVAPRRRHAAQRSASHGVYMFCSVCCRVCSELGFLCVCVCPISLRFMCVALSLSLSLILFLLLVLFVVSAICPCDISCVSCFSPPCSLSPLCVFCVFLLCCRLLRLSQLLVGVARRPLRRVLFCVRFFVPPILNNTLYFVC